jgi:Maltokinase N-terminal cap domain
VALLYKTSLVPSKLELIARWAPSQRWFAGEAHADFENVASFRFDDPAGEVGAETIFVRAGVGPAMHIPLTYRGEPVAGAERFLIGTMEHGVLGTRWVYDAVGDPVYLEELARAALTGGAEVELHYELDGVRTYKDANARVCGSGAPDSSVPSAHDDHIPAIRDDESSTLAETDHLEFLVARQPVSRPLSGDTNAQSLIGTWIGQSEPATLALVSLRG